MKITMIASGSKGNMCYIESNEAKIIIDCGISYKRIVKYFENHNLSYDIDAVLITHEHGDHVSGLKNFVKSIKCPVYMTKGTMVGIKEKYSKNGDFPFDAMNLEIISHDDEFDIKDIHVKAIPLSHDVYDPTGFILTSCESKIVYITDTGYVPSVFYEDISNATCYVMETNHDPAMLMQCTKRPYETRVRILGDKGHLSNEDAIDLLAHIIGDRTKLVFYAHISEECNLWNLIDAESKRIFKSYQMDVSNIKFVYTSQLATEEFDV